MPYSIYESIDNNQPSLVHAFVAPIENSAFHWHNEYELIGVLSGSINVRIQSEIVTYREGDVLLVNPNVIHALQSVDGEENLCMVIQLRPSLFAFDVNDASDLCFYLDSTGDEIPKCGFEHFFYRMAKIVYETMNDEKHAIFRARAETCCLIADLFDYVVYDVRFRDAAIRNNQELAVKMIEYFESHLEDEKIMELACHEFGLSRKTLDRSFKMTIGVTGKEIVDSLRMEKAKNLLKNTNKNMNYILDSCGFGSEKTFYRMFRQDTGLTPKEFREKGQIMMENSELKGYLDYETPKVKLILRRIIVSGERARDGK